MYLRILRNFEQREKQVAKIYRLSQHIIHPQTSRGMISIKPSKINYFNSVCYTRLFSKLLQCMKYGQPKFNINSQIAI